MYTRYILSPRVRSDGDRPRPKTHCQLSTDSRLNDSALPTPPQAELVEETGSWLGTGRIVYAEPHSLTFHRKYDIHPTLVFPSVLAVLLL